MNPEHITITKVDHTAVAELVRACNEFIQHHYVPSDTHNNLGQAAARKLRQRLITKALGQSINSLRLNEVEYRTIMVMAQQVWSPRSSEALYRFTSQIHPKIC